MDGDYDVEGFYAGGTDENVDAEFAYIQSDTLSDHEAEEAAPARLIYDYYLFIIMFFIIMIVMIIIKTSTNKQSHV